MRKLFKSGNYSREETIHGNTVGTQKLKLKFIKALITLFTFTYLQLDQERQVGDFSVVPTASSMTFFIGSRELKEKYKNKINLTKSLSCQQM